MSEQAEPVALVAYADIELLALVQTGNREAFRLLFKNHQRPVYVCALRVLGSASDAEEIVQDTFLTMWNKRNKIELAGDSALPWLLVTARFLALNRHRSNQRSSTEPLNPAVDVVADAESLDEKVVLAELMEALEVSIAAMPQVDQEIFNLCLVEGVNYEQAAKRLGITHGSVRNRLSRLKGKLRSQLNVSQEGQQS